MCTLRYRDFPLLLAFFVASSVAGAEPKSQEVRLVPSSKITRGRVGAQTRHVLADGESRLAMTVPPDALLEVGVGVPAAEWNEGLTQIELSVSLERNGQRHELGRVEVRRETTDRWHDLVIPLSAYAGQAGELRLETKRIPPDVAPDTDAYWSVPRLVTNGNEQRPNIILFSIDTLRADRLGCYGNERPTSPTIDRLAAQGVRFSRAIAPSSWTLPSHATMFTGLHPHRHEAIHFAWFGGLRTDQLTFAERLWESGYATAGFTGGAFLNPVFGFDQGFDRYAFEVASDLEQDEGFEQGVRAAREWIERQKGGPFFIFLHTFNVHLPYAAPPPYDRMFDPEYSGPFETQFTREDAARYGKTGPYDARTIEHLKALYDGEIRRADDIFAELVSFLESSDVADRTCIIITSDHGEEFQEHGGLLHNSIKLYEELIHVPLIFWCPSRYAGGRVIDEVVSLVDLMPTILDMAGETVPDEIDGKSLEPLLRGGKAPGRTMALSEVDASVEKRQGTLMSLRTDRHKLIVSTWDPSPLLFDLQSDPGETRNQSSAQPEIAARLTEVLRSMHAAAPAMPPAAETTSAEDPAEEKAVDPAVKERLRALGYFE